MDVNLRGGRVLARGMTGPFRDVRRVPGVRGPDWPRRAPYRPCPATSVRYGAPRPSARPGPSLCVINHAMAKNPSWKSGNVLILDGKTPAQSPRLGGIPAAGPVCFPLVGHQFADR